MQQTSQKRTEDEQGCTASLQLCLKSFFSVAVMMSQLLAIGLVFDVCDNEVVQTVLSVMPSKYCNMQDATAWSR